MALALASWAPADAAGPPGAEGGEAAASAAAAETPGQWIAHRVATYVPNRIFDLLDVLRFRMRFGAGFAASFRMTRPVSSTVGSYSTFYMGLHGPRGEPKFPSPIGFEDFAWDREPLSAPSPPPPPPYYGPAEVGFGFQLAFIGVDVGVAPFEALDVASGLLLVDLAGDDL